MIPPAPRASLPGERGSRLCSRRRKAVLAAGLGQQPARAGWPAWMGAAGLSAGARGALLGLCDDEGLF